MMRMTETWWIRAAKWLICVPVMVLIGILQAVGTVLTAISAVVFKVISSLIIFVTILFMIFGFFTWRQTAVVTLIGVSMFWLPEGIALVIFGLCLAQVKLTVDLSFSFSSSPLHA